MKKTPPIIRRSKAEADLKRAAGFAKELHYPVKADLEVLYEDDHSLVVFKPAGLLVTPDRFEPSADTLTNRIWYYLWEKLGMTDEVLNESRPRMVHRLDRDTSGVMVYAKTIEGQRELTEQFEKHRVLKTYLAIVDGRITKSSDHIDYPIGHPPRVNHSTRGKMFIGTPSAKAAVTNIKTLEAHEMWSLVQASPRTGRTHQVRLHMSAYGHSLMVDPLYGKREALRISDLHIKRLEQSDEVLMNRLTLHAASIDFIKVTGTGRGTERVCIEAGPPEDFVRLLTFLQTECSAE